MTNQTTHPTRSRRRSRRESERLSRVRPLQVGPGDDVLRAPLWIHRWTVDDEVFGLNIAVGTALPDGLKMQGPDGEPVLLRSGYEHWALGGPAAQASFADTISRGFEVTLEEVLEEPYPSEWPGEEGLAQPTHWQDLQRPRWHEVGARVGGYPEQLTYFELKRPHENIGALWVAFDIEALTGRLLQIVYVTDVAPEMTRSPSFRFAGSFARAPRGPRDARQWWAFRFEEPSL